MFSVVAIEMAIQPDVEMSDVYTACSIKSATLRGTEQQEAYLRLVDSGGKHIHCEIRTRVRERLSFSWAVIMP